VQHTASRIPVTTLIQITHDHEEGCYRVTRQDDRAHRLEVLEGQLTEGRLVVTSEDHRRLTLHDITPEGFQLDPEQSPDDGTTWIQTTRFTFRDVP
jgi:hypothetical protein